MSFPSSPVLITGASQGIGRVIATVFARETGRPLILLSRSEKKLEESKRACVEAGAEADKILTLSCDATDPRATAGLALPDDFAPPGILVNNAGGFLFKKLQDTTDREFHAQVELNLFAAVNITNRFLPDMKGMERGLIINTCSVASLVGYGNSGAYAASKHAILGYTRSLRKELYDTSIGVTAINLGQTYSTSWEDTDVNPDQLIDPEDVGRLMVGLTRLSPRTVVEEVILKPQGGGV